MTYFLRRTPGEREAHRRPDHRSAVGDARRLIRVPAIQETLCTIVVTEADKVHIHPVRGYLDGLRWDGEHRLD